MTTIAIMQPTYLPWLGYFAMIDRVDCFLLLDTVQFARRSWQQRNQIKSAQGAQWLSVPVLSKGRREQLIQDVAISAEAGFPADHLEAIRHNYRRSRYFETYFAPLSAVLTGGCSKLSELNGRLIGWLCEELQVATPIRWASGLVNTGDKAERLAALCEQLGGTRYLAAPASREYLEQSDAFSRRQITVTYHQYEHPVYPQLFGDFLPYMSVVDLLFNTGPEALRILRQGCAARAAVPG